MIKRKSGLTTPDAKPEFVFLASVPDVPELVFRGFRGNEDFPAMHAVIEASKKADGRDHSESLEDLIRNYAHLMNSDPALDVVFAEIEDNVVGYGRVWWRKEFDGSHIYSHLAFLKPAWRGMGIREAMVRHNEARLHAIAAAHLGETPKSFESWASQHETDWTAILEGEGYSAVRYSFEMVRPNLNDVPESPMPAGLEVRPVCPEQHATIWAAAREAFRDHWGFSEDEWDTELTSWRESPSYVPDYWQVAWDGDQVAGMVLNFIDTAENEENHRLRGYTETICVRRPWRRRGLARALIARSLRMLKELGMTEAALGVDADNPHGALQLYESMGYQVVSRQTCYRKPLNEPLPMKRSHST